MEIWHIIQNMQFVQYFSAPSDEFIRNNKWIALNENRIQLFLKNMLYLTHKRTGSSTKTSFSLVMAKTWETQNQPTGGNIHE